jgi:hypothetical protein
MVLRLRRAAPDWQQGKCLGQATGPDMDPWFDNTDLDYDDQTELGLEVCNGEIDGIVCPIREACLEFALVNNERFGVWGGTSEVDRRAIRKMWPWDGTAEPRPEWKWFPPGEVAKLLPARTRAEVELGDDDDDE